MPNDSSHFEEILMPPALLANLYKKSLVLVDAESDSYTVSTITDVLNDDDEDSRPAKVSGTEAPEWKTVEPIAYLGNFKQKIAIILSDENNVHAGESELELLSKMLQALRLSLADVAVINLYRLPAVNWDRLLQSITPTSVILFGVESADFGVPMRIPHFKVHDWSETRFLASPSLTIINTPGANQNQLKKDLWGGLQEMFRLR